jgi:hypothetical protein
MLSQILHEYRSNFSKEIAQDTFPEMQDLMNLFCQDAELNQAQTNVKGDQFCDIVALLVDLAECMRLDLLNRLREMTHFKQAYLKTKKTPTPKTKTRCTSVLTQHEREATQ